MNKDKTKPLKMPSGECSDGQGMRYKVIVYNVCKGDEKVPTIRSKYERESKEQALIYAECALILAETDKTIHSVCLYTYEKCDALIKWRKLDLKAMLRKEKDKP